MIFHRKKSEDVRFSEPTHQSQIIIGECIQVLYPPPSPSTLTTLPPPATTATITPTPSPPPSSRSRSRSRSPHKKANTKDIKNPPPSPISGPTRPLRISISSQKGNIDI